MKGGQCQGSMHCQDELPNKPLPGVNLLKHKLKILFSFRKIRSDFDTSYNLLRVSTTIQINKCPLVKKKVKESRQTLWHGGWMVVRCAMVTLTRVSVSILYIFFSFLSKSKKQKCSQFMPDQDLLETLFSLQMMAVLLHRQKLFSFVLLHLKLQHWVRPLQ